MIIPAAPGTFLLERDPGTVPPRVIRTVIIGWKIADVSAPITVAYGAVPIRDREAIVHPSGHVDDPLASLAFTNETEWLAFHRATPTTDEEEEGLKMVEPESIPEMPRFYGIEPIKFGTKTFKTKSFWLAEEHQAVFSIEGGQPVPDDDRCLKIIRDTFVAHKRDGLPEIDPHDGEVEDDGMDLV